MRLVHQQIDAKRRDAIRANHSATHLLHEALRRVLGDHVTQKGSLVNEHHLRFDFSHPRAMNDNEIDEVEALVNNIIRQNEEVATRLMTPDEAIEAGALALFGEKYGEEVRVLSMGLGREENDDAAYSVELCGGTHVRRLGDIGLLKISQEGAVASGVRRIEARTGEGALAQIAAHDHVLHAATSELKVAVQDLPARVAKLVEERKSLDRELAEVKKQLALAGASNVSSKMKRRAARSMAHNLWHAVLTVCRPSNCAVLSMTAKAKSAAAWWCLSALMATRRALPSA